MQVSIEIGSEGKVVGGYEEDPYLPCGAYLIAVDFNGEEIYVDFASLSKRPPSEFDVTPKQDKVRVTVFCSFAHYSVNHHNPYTPTLPTPHYPSHLQYANSVKRSKKKPFRLISNR